MGLVSELDPPGLLREIRIGEENGQLGPSPFNSRSAGNPAGVVRGVASRRIDALEDAPAAASRVAKAPGGKMLCLR